MIPVLELSALIGIFARTVFVWNIAKEMMNVLPDKDAMKKTIARVNAMESYAAHPKFASMANVKTHVKKSIQISENYHCNHGVCYSHEPCTQDEDCPDLWYKCVHGRCKTCEGPICPKK